MTSPLQSSESPAHPYPLRDATLDSLAAMSTDELRAVYSDAHMPASMVALDGSPLGRMLAIAGTGTGFVASGLRRFAAARRFPWDGKSFAASSPTAGRGINRVRLGGRHLLFPFATDIAPSRLDGRPAIRLDYDLDDNPQVIRRIHDEVRLVCPGLFLGPAMWLHDSSATLVLWFALDTRMQAAPIRWG